MPIEILKDVIKGFRVRVVDADGLTLRTFTYPTIATLGHGNIATTSGYLHGRPESSSGLKLDPGVFLR